MGTLTDKLSSSEFSNGEKDKGQGKKYCKIKARVKNLR